MPPSCGRSYLGRMGISKNKELEVNTSADSEAELLELARTIKEKESEGFDSTRME